jgi:hypothetical protein
LLVRLQVCGERMTVWAFLMDRGLVLGLLHGAAPPRKMGSVSTVARTSPRVQSRAGEVAWPVREDAATNRSAALTTLTVSIPLDEA